KKISTSGRLVECLVDSHEQMVGQAPFSDFFAEDPLFRTATKWNGRELSSLAPSARFHVPRRCLNVATGYHQFPGIYQSISEAQLGLWCSGTVYAVRDSTQGEVAYGRLSVLRHCNLLSIEGVRLLETREPTIPRKMPSGHSSCTWTSCSSDVWQLMQNRQLTLRKRIWFGLQLARALEFLHSSASFIEIAAVDAELTTISRLLKSTGLTGQSLVGTADLFGTGDGHQQPAMISVPMSTALALLCGISDRTDLPCHTADLWDLMERCWDAQPRNRPPAKEVADALDYIEKPEKSSEEEATTGLPTEDSSSSCEKFEENRVVSDNRNEAQGQQLMNDIKARIGKFTYKYEEHVK
uniref:Protein kinase domain-containing protein n=1 Tax=Macrostomum lignano TaxID=282301 RepID=A0A1I8JNX5_9PLAT